MTKKKNFRREQATAETVLASKKLMRLTGVFVNTRTCVNKSSVTVYLVSAEIIGHPKLNARYLGGT
jgi:hypothetical protein